MLVLLVVVPLFLGIFQVGLVLHVRNTLTSAASEGARYAATVDRPVDAGAARAREQISFRLSRSRNPPTVDTSALSASFVLPAGRSRSTRRVQTSPGPAGNATFVNASTSG